MFSSEKEVVEELINDDTAFISATIIDGICFCRVFVHLFLSARNSDRIVRLRLAWRIHEAIHHC